MQNETPKEPKTIVLHHWDEVIEKINETDPKETIEVHVDFKPEKRGEK